MSAVSAESGGGADSPFEQPLQVQAAKVLMAPYAPAAMLLLAACSHEEPKKPVTDPDDVPFTYAEVELTPYVDPMVGTGGAGNTIPGALVPHGMVRATPDTHAEAGAIDAYRYEDTRLDGFVHTQLEGPGGSFNG